MANLLESIQYEPTIYQLETTDPVIAGRDGIANRQANQLANRTAWLRQQINELVSDLDSLESSNSDLTDQLHTLNDSFLSNLNENGLQKLPSGLIIQWGLERDIPVNSPAGLFHSGRKFWNFPITFPNTCFSVFSTGINSGGKVEFSAPIDPPTLSGVFFYPILSGPGIGIQNLLAIGY